MIEWKDGAICFADGRQWFGEGTECLIDLKDFQLNEIRIGDYVEKSELDTEQKYNDVVEVFGLFGFKKLYPGVSFRNLNSNLYIDSDSDVIIGEMYIKRKLTYNQIMAIGKLKRMMNERAEVKAFELGVNAGIDAINAAGLADVHRKINGATSKSRVSADNDQVKNPNHYQLMNVVESIEIIARSMTNEQWKGFCLGNMLKYRIRAGKKDALQQDIDKANFYGELYEMHKEKCYEN